MSRPAITPRSAKPDAGLRCSGPARVAVRRVDLDVGGLHLQARDVNVGPALVGLDAGHGLATCERGLVT